MATIVQCNCGAEYRRTEEKFLVPHTGDVVCANCGAALESWWKSTHVPSFELIKTSREKAGMTKRPRDPNQWPNLIFAVAYRPTATCVATAEVLKLTALGLRTATASPSN